MLVVRDGVGMAYMGHPFAPYLSLGVFLVSMNTSVLFFDRNHYPFLVFILAYLLFFCPFFFIPVR